MMWVGPVTNITEIKNIKRYFWHNEHVDDRSVYLLLPIKPASYHLIFELISDQFLQSVLAVFFKTKFYEKLSLVFA